jgi:nitrous oxidase accessory protein NosD
MKSTHVLPVLIATAAASLVLAAGAGATRSKPIACGDTITASVKLDHDLTDCPSNGVIIGADGITLDLNGHTIDGDDAQQDCEPGADCDLGVLNVGHRAVTINGGAIDEFGLGLLVAGSDENRLRDLAVTANEFAGILMVDGDGGDISRSSVTRNGTATGGSGIVLFNADHSRVTRDVVSANGDTGIEAHDSRRILVADNVVNDQPTGIGTGHVDDSVITRNRAVRDGGAVILIGDHNTVRRNYVAETAHCPEDVCGQSGAISFEGGTGNVIEQNLVERTLEPGIRLAAFEPETPPADGNTVRHNVIRGALDGIFVEETATHTLLDGNVAVGSADDGIDVDNAATTLRRNVADRNGDLGIEAVTGVTDGGHNRAHGNGNPAQCLNVICR